MEQTQSDIGFKCEFYESDHYLKQVSEMFFPQLAEGHTYGYFDVSAKGKRVKIHRNSRNGPHPYLHQRWETVIGKFSAAFRGASVLDLGGAEGFWSIKSALCGARNVTMIERSSKAVKCAEYLFDFFGVENVSIISGDLREVKLNEHDIVLAMRIIHWLENEDRDKLIDLLPRLSKLALFLNADEEIVIPIFSKYMHRFDYVQYGGKGFMAHLKCFKRMPIGL